MTQSHRSTPLVDEEGRQLESFSYTRRQTLQQCPRLFHLRYNVGVQPALLAKPLRMGSAYSDALEHADVSKVNDYYLKLIVDYPSGMREELVEEAAVVEGLATTYLAMRSEEKWTREVEFGPLVLPHGLADNGRFDGYSPEGHAYDTNVDIILLENKCKGRWGDVEKRMLEQDEQCTSYIANASIKYGVKAERIKLLYDVAVKPSYRRGKKGHAEFVAHIKSDLAARGADQHHRSIVTRTTAQCEEYLEEMRNQAEFKQVHQEKALWPQHRFACGNYGGCEMIDICYASKDEVSEIIRTKYKIER